MLIRLADALEMEAAQLAHIIIQAAGRPVNTPEALRSSIRWTDISSPLELT
jgi:hypothetical protein